MSIFTYTIQKAVSIFIVALLFLNTNTSAQQKGINDTLLTSAIIYEGDTISAKTLPTVYISAYLTHAAANWTRLRNAVYVTYPYALRAAAVFNDVNLHIQGKSHNEIHDYIQTREKELRKEFSEPLMNLSVYQGKILMKLINRETGNNVYNILKEFRGGFNARIWQTVAFFFGSNLKQSYDAQGEDVEIEKIVKEVRRMYGYRT